MRKCAVPGRAPCRACAAPAGHVGASLAVAVSRYPDRLRHAMHIWIGGLLLQIPVFLMFGLVGALQHGWLQGATADLPHDPSLQEATS